MKICGVISNDQKRELDEAPQLRAGGLLADPIGELIHEFTNTITAVIGYSELALHAVEERHQERAWLEKVGAHTRQLGSLLNKLIDLERLEHGGQRVVKVVGGFNQFLPFMDRLMPRRAVRWLMGVSVKLPRTLHAEKLRR